MSMNRIICAPLLTAITLPSGERLAAWMYDASRNLLVPRRRRTPSGSLLSSAGAEPVEAGTAGGSAGGWATGWATAAAASKGRASVAGMRMERPRKAGPMGAGRGWGLG